MTPNEERFWRTKWAIRLFISLAVVATVAVLFFGTVFLAKWMIDVKEQGKQNTEQIEENKTDITENTADINEHGKSITESEGDITVLKENDFGTPTPSPAAKRKAKHRVERRPWWRRIF